MCRRLKPIIYQITKVNLDIWTIVQNCGKIKGGLKWQNLVDINIELDVIYHIVKDWLINFNKRSVDILYNYYKTHF